MKKLNVHEAKTHLSRYLEIVEQGETIILCKRNIPVAEMHPIAKSRKFPRPTGLGKGKFKIGQDFDKPLPKEILKLFGA